MNTLDFGKNMKKTIDWLNDWCLNCRNIRANCVCRKPKFKKERFKFKRFCLNCFKATKFVLDEKIGHSKCIVCNGYKALDLRNKEGIELVFLGYRKGKGEVK